jgi:hypothetical protein
MENYQVDLIPLPNKQAEYIAQGVSQFAAGIAGGISSYGQSMAKSIEAENKRKRELLNRYALIQLEDNKAYNEAAVKIESLGGSARDFRANAKKDGEKASYARLQIETNTSLSEEERQGYLSQISKFETYIGSSKNLEAAIYANNQRIEQDRLAGKVAGTNYTASYMNGSDELTAENAEKTQKYNQALESYQKGGSTLGYVIETKNENMDGTSVNTYIIKDKEGNVLHTVQQDPSSNFNRRVNIQRHNFETVGVEAEILDSKSRELLEQYVLGKQYSSIASGVSGYQSIMQQEIVDTEAIDFALTNKSNVDVETFVQTMDTDELIAYMDYTLGMTLEESINTVNNTDADVRLKYIQDKASEKLKKDYRLKMGLKERAVTDADRQFASAIGRPLPEDQKTLFTRKGGDDKLLQTAGTISQTTEAQFARQNIKKSLSNLAETDISTPNNFIKYYNQNGLNYYGNAITGDKILDQLVNATDTKGFVLDKYDYLRNALKGKEGDTTTPAERRAIALEEMKTTENIGANTVILFGGSGTQKNRFEANDKKAAIRAILIAQGYPDDDISTVFMELWKQYQD